MTAFDRIEQRMPELMAEMASAGTPDYFEDMLRQAAATRQRPAWASLERWLPMGVIARTETFRSPSMRPIVLLLILGLIVLAGAMLYVGSQRTALPSPFGPARNGTILIGTTAGDIAVLDPATGATTTLIGGPTRDVAPWFSPDGQRFVFVRMTGADTGAYWIADADGSDARELVGPSVDWLEWAQDSDRIVVSHSVDGIATTSIVDTSVGSAVTLDLEIEIRNPVWRPNHDQIIFWSEAAGPHQFHVLDADGTGLRRIATAPGAINLPALSPDGSKLAYATWGAGDGRGERIHVVDIESGIDTLATPDAYDGYLWQSPQFMPDGKSIVVGRYTPGGGPYQLAILAADGSGTVRPIGPVRTLESGGANVTVSPDGTKVLAQYDIDGQLEPSVWLIDVAGGPSQELAAGADAATWQRLAP